MGKIIALGGGEMRSGETLSIDEEIIRLSGKKHPKLLFIPTASDDSIGYIETIENYFGKTLGCEVDSLCLHTNPGTEEERKIKILGLDIVYVGGGNTLKMMKLWRKYGVDVLLQKAWKNGVVMSGLSAGSICWFRQGHSDSRKGKDPSKKFDFMKVTGLGFVNILHCPHYDVEDYRRPELHKMMLKTPGVAIAIDNCAAIEIIEDTYRIITSKPDAKAYKVYKKNGVVIEEIIDKSTDFRDLNELFKK